MPERKRKPRKPDDGHGDFVPAVFAKDADDAQDYADLLKDHDIPAICGTGPGLEKQEDPAADSPRRGMTRGVPVLVPENLLDEASEVIADREDLAEFGSDDLDEDEEEEEEDFGYPKEIDDVEADFEDDEEEFFGDEDV